MCYEMLQDFSHVHRDSLDISLQKKKGIRPVTFQIENVEIRQGCF